MSKLNLQQLIKWHEEEIARKTDYADCLSDCNTYDNPMIENAIASGVKGARSHIEFHGEAVHLLKTYE